MHRYALGVSLIIFGAWQSWAQPQLMVCFVVGPSARRRTKIKISGDVLRASNALFTLLGSFDRYSPGPVLGPCARGPFYEARDWRSIRLYSLASESAFSGLSR